MTPRAKLGLGATAAFAAGVAWQRVSPSACPYSQRWPLELLRPGLSPGLLERILEPMAGERLLEVGPGHGIFALPAAERIAPRGNPAGRRSPG